MESAINKQVENIAETWQELIKNNLASTESGGALAQKLIFPEASVEERNSLILFSDAHPQAVLADLGTLQRIAGALPRSAQQLEWDLSTSRLIPTSPTPNKLALFHVIIDSPVTMLIANPALLAIGTRKDWKRALYSVFADSVIAVDYSEDFATSLSILRETSQHTGVSAVYIRYCGLLIWGEKAEDTVKAAKEMAQTLEASFPKTTNVKNAGVEVEEPSLLDIAIQRAVLSKEFGAPHLCVFNQAEIPEGVSSVQHSNLNLKKSKIGLAICARSAGELISQTRQLETELQIRALTKGYPARDWLPFASAQSVIFNETHYDGEVAIITGAATGIGKATVQALLDRGASVAAFDIKPQISETFDTPAYMGIQVDLTDETATKAAIAKVVRSFGGVDMLVLNAGIFPASCNIDALSMEHWRKVMAINVDVNITMLRELYPFLKLAPRYGRVVINSSRNVPAPGPGAVSYSASKAALTQVGRVAALEWANSGIRVNMVNPHAVFDTELWSDEIIRSRAVKYNMTVEQYKTNNLLHVELFSRDVGELIASMLGPLFAKTTGAQVPVDGGSDRVV